MFASLKVLIFLKEENPLHKVWHVWFDCKLFKNSSRSSLKSCELVDRVQSYHFFKLFQKSLFC